jgi:hypothetical protein
MSQQCCSDVTAVFAVVLLTARQLMVGEQRHEVLQHFVAKEFETLEQQTVTGPDL